MNVEQQTRGNTADHQQQHLQEQTQKTKHQDSTRSNPPTNDQPTHTTKQRLTLTLPNNDSHSLYQTTTHRPAGLALLLRSTFLVTS